MLRKRGPGNIGSTGDWIIASPTATFANLHYADDFPYGYDSSWPYLKQGA